MVEVVVGWMYVFFVMIDNEMIVGFRVIYGLWIRGIIFWF